MFGLIQHPRMSQSFEAYLTNSETLAGHLLDHAAWSGSRPVQLKHYWSGELAPLRRHAEVRALWTSEALFVRFDCQQHEPLVLSNEPQTAQNTMGLWDRDVCEIFIAPNANEPQRYFEFEAAPTGEWLDLAIHQLADERETNWDYTSGMKVAACVEDELVTIAIQIPFEAFGCVPQLGTHWRANLFRCIGVGDKRGYIAWQPTLTERPNFHVPEAFGWLSFVG